MRFFTPSSVLGLLLSEMVLAFACFVIAFYLVLPVDPLVFPSGVT